MVAWPACAVVTAMTASTAAYTVWTPQSHRTTRWKRSPRRSNSRVATIPTIPYAPRKSPKYSSVAWAKPKTISVVFRRSRIRRSSAPAARFRRASWTNPYPNITAKTG
jgi:hypothetical protein